MSPNLKALYRDAIKYRITKAHITKTPGYIVVTLALQDYAIKTGYILKRKP